MFRPAALFIGLRYTRAKQRNHFISFIAMFSMIGIALGVAVLITVLSVMNGFDQEIRSRVFNMVPAITVGNISGNLSDWQKLQKDVALFPGVLASAPFATGEVLISHGGSVQASLLNGIIPSEQVRVTKLGDKIVEGNLDALKPGKFGIVLGEELAGSLYASVGDKITVVTPQVSLTPAGVIPRFKRFTVVGIFRAGSGFGFDRSLAFINLTDAQKLLGLGSNVSGLHVAIEDPYNAGIVASKMTDNFSEMANISTWADQFGEFFRAVQLEKTMMFLILLLIVAVAAFNLVSTLVMVVNEKNADIAILRTYGATPGMIMRIFIMQGGLIGVFGTALGVIGGVLLAMNVTAIVNGIEHVFHVQFLSSNVYFVNYLPSVIKWSDVAKISIASLILSLVATVYPAWRAARLDPVEALHYE